MSIAARSGRWLRSSNRGLADLDAKLALVATATFQRKRHCCHLSYAKANPGKISMASGGIGTPSHVSGELFKMMTGVNMVHVPYRGAAPAMTDLIAGQVQVYFTTASIEYIRAGKLRALAVTTAVRSDVLPEVPTVGDFVPGYEASGFFGVGAPKNTPADIIEKLTTRSFAADFPDFRTCPVV
jgi:tripartite-type tricarboxylate transporter receptor subunit TctC